MQYKWWIRATGNAVLLLVLAVLVLLLGGAVSYGMGWL
jgi:hypothetical protein